MLVYATHPAGNSQALTYRASPTNHHTTSNKGQQVHSSGLGRYLQKMRTEWEGRGARSYKPARLSRTYPVRQNYSSRCAPARIPWYLLHNRELTCSSLATIAFLPCILSAKALPVGLCSTSLTLPKAPFPRSVLSRQGKRGVSPKRRSAPHRTSRSTNISPECPFDRGAVARHG